jgi:hypothetical protein
MILTVTYDADGTKTDIIEGHRISSQIFPGTTTALVLVYNKDDLEVASYQYTMVYRMHKDQQ